jgi:hypothetical protein
VRSLRASMISQSLATGSAHRVGWQQGQELSVTQSCVVALACQHHPYFQRHQPWSRSAYIPRPGVQVPRCTEVRSWRLHSQIRRFKYATSASYHKQAHHVVSLTG